AGVDGGAAGEQGVGLRRPAVVGQVAEERVADDRAGQARSAAVLDQVVRARVRLDPLEGPALRAVGHDRVVPLRRAAVVDAAPCDEGRVAAEGAGGDSQRARVEDPAAQAADRVAAEGAGGDSQRARVEDPAAEVGGRVAVEGAGGDTQRARVVDPTAYG